MRAVLVDAGPLVALLDRSDAHHGEVVAALRKIQDPLLSVWPVLVEAVYLLSFSRQEQKALWEIFETGTVQLLPLEDEAPEAEGNVSPLKESSRRQDERSGLREERFGDVGQSSRRLGTVQMRVGRSLTAERTCQTVGKCSSPARNVSDG